jgi:para-nitrobenzyl esterase
VPFAKERHGATSFLDSVNAAVRSFFAASCGAETRKGRQEIVPASLGRKLVRGGVAMNISYRTLIALAALVLVALAAPALADDPAIVRVQGGLVRGSGDDIRVFKGIPYAAPPVGRLRWRPPQPAPSWSGVRDAAAYGPACMQPGDELKEMSEDCLTVNVWAPRPAKNEAKNQAKKLPVMVFFHGGGWLGDGSAKPLYDGTKLARRGVVLVTLNYRLGVLGFLAHPALSAESPQHVSSNYGLRDQITALHWVRDNIAAFGGDPGNVTIFGQSAGAQAVCDLLIIPSARGLFVRGIMESAPVMRPGYVQMTLAQAEQDGRRYGEDIAALRRMTPEALMAMTPSLEPETRANIANAFYPVRDGVMLSLDEKTALATGRVARVPIIIGNNTDEGTFYARNVPVKTLDSYRAYLKYRFRANATEAERLYPASDDKSANHAQGVITSDTLTWGVREFARDMSKLAPTYRYIFSHLRNGLAPMHTGELPFVFGQEVDSRSLQPLPFTAADRHISDFMEQAWVNFARTGNPNGPGMPVAWPRFDTQSQRYVEIGDEEVSVGSGWRDAQIDFIGRTLRR